jgi:hypothetical protein
MSRGPLQRWRERGGRIVELVIPFSDIMEIGLALLTLSPDELDALGWTFLDRKRILNQFLASGRQAQKIDRASLENTELTLRPRRKALTEFCLARTAQTRDARQRD